MSQEKITDECWRGKFVSTKFYLTYCVVIERNKGGHSNL